MKVFYRSYDANGQLEASLRLEDIPDNQAYEVAGKVYSPEYVEAQLDGKGWITIRTPKTHGGHTDTVYQQDSL